MFIKFSHFQKILYSLHFCKYSVLKLPSGQSSPQPYLLTLIPPLVLSLLDPEIFFKALDFAGTYGGITAPFFSFVYDSFSDSCSTH